MWFARVSHPDWFTAEVTAAGTQIEKAEHVPDLIWTLRIETRFLGLPNRSLVTYRMHYPGPTPEKCMYLCDLFSLHALCTRKIVPFSNTGYSVPSLWKHFSAFAIDYLAIDTKQRHYYTDAHTRWLALSVGFPRGQCWACWCIDCSNGRWDDLLDPSKEDQHDFSGKVLFYGWSKMLQSCNEAIKFLPVQIPTFLYSQQVKSLMLHWKK